MNRVNPEKFHSVQPFSGRRIKPGTTGYRDMPVVFSAVISVKLEPQNIF
jgi:hypothetical protein